MPEKPAAPKTFTIREAGLELGLGLTQMRAWVAIWVELVGELPRTSDAPNAARMLSGDVIAAIRQARAVVGAVPGQVSSEDALRRVLGLAESEKKTDPKHQDAPDPKKSNAASEAAPNLGQTSSQIESLRHEVAMLRHELHYIRETLDIVQSESLPAFAVTVRQHLDALTRAVNALALTPLSQTNRTKD